jgi:hypothetical protein
MRVAENDKVVQGMLEDEYHRCRDALQSLYEKIRQYPKGALNVRKKKYKGKEYSYHYLVSREGGKIVNRHIAEKNIPNLNSQLKARDLCRKEIRSYEKRIAYLERILKTSASK